MIEQLIERLVAEGKITPEEIQAKIEELKAQRPPSQEEMKIKELEVQQHQTNEDLAGLMDFIISGGM